MEKIKKIINIEDSVGKHWDINRAFGSRKIAEVKTSDAKLFLIKMEEVQVR